MGFHNRAAGIITIDPHPPGHLPLSVFARLLLSVGLPILIIQIPAKNVTAPTNNILNELLPTTGSPLIVNIQRHTTLLMVMSTPTPEQILPNHRQAFCLLFILVIPRPPYLIPANVLYQNLSLRSTNHRKTYRTSLIPSLILPLLLLLFLAPNAQLRLLLAGCLTTPCSMRCDTAIQPQS